jgi:ubiquinone/menaquinone biosynthesis C-methylase UbiE
MQAYQRPFARVYNRRWTNFSQALAPRLLAYYESAAPEPVDKTLLDLCCGTGQLAVHFLAQGYRVTGLDLSADMLALARENCQIYTEAGQAQFIQGDAADFQLEKPVGLVVSVFDSLNHLESFDALQACFRCVYRALNTQGLFIFDLNTRCGLTRHWNGINVDDTQELMLVNRAIYDGLSDRAYTRISGFVQNQDGTYERFEETIYNTVFNMQTVKEALLAAGFLFVHFAHGHDLAAPLEDPESVSRVFLVARK